MYHMFDVSVAEMVGVNAAILFQNISFWCEHSAANDTNYYDENYWTYSSNKAFQSLFPYMTGRQIDTALKKLIDAGLVIRGNHNKSAYDRTMWYAITENGKSIYTKCKMENHKKGNGNCGNVEPIPYIVTDTTDVSNDNNKDISTRKRFTPPTVDDVQAYATEKGWSNKEFSAESFTNYYQSIGWMVRGKKMVDWKASARGWVSRYRQEHPQEAARVYKDADYENDW